MFSSHSAENRLYSTRFSSSERRARFAALKWVAHALPEGDCGWKRIALFLGGVCVTRVPLGGASHLFLGGSKVRVMTWHLKNPVPPKAWGFGGKAPMWSPSFNIDMHVDIHLNIDCQLSFDLICRTYSSRASHNFACKSVSDKWVFASRTLSSMAWYAAMAAGLQKRIVCFEVYVRGPCDCWGTHCIFFQY